MNAVKRPGSLYFSAIVVFLAQTLLANFGSVAAGGSFSPACVRRVARLLVKFAGVGRLDLAAVGVQRAGAGRRTAELHGLRRFRGRLGRGGLWPSAGGGEQHCPNHE